MILLANLWGSNGSWDGLDWLMVAAIATIFLLLMVLIFAYSVVEHLIEKLFRWLTNRKK